MNIVSSRNSQSDDANQLSIDQLHVQALVAANVSSFFKKG